MKKLRALLYSSLGQEGYLSLVSGIYIKLVSWGFFKAKYPELFFLKKLLKPNFVCLDIGANVGYYSTIMAKLSQHVHAIEPVPLFGNVFKKNIENYNNISLHAVALGAENKKISMGTPTVDGVFRHGLTKVLDGSETDTNTTYEVMMRIPDELFADLNRLDFIKCDVEGYEVHLFPHLVNTLNRFRPIIQIEITSEENRFEMFSLLQGLGYRIKGLKNNGLIDLSYNEAMQYQGGDFYFVAQ